MEANEPEEIFMQIQEFLGNAGKRLSIVEDVVDISIQKDYFRMAEQFRNKQDTKEVNVSADILFSNDTTEEQLKEVLVLLASSGEVESYRAIEKFVSVAPSQLKGWALLALNECRFHLVGALTDEEGVLISTGMGGLDGKLRYFIVLIPAVDMLSQQQAKLVTDEVKFMFKHYDSEVERGEMADRYMCITALVPMSVPVNQPVTAVIKECNGMGNLLDEGYIVTNVKTLAPDEIRKVLNREPIDGIYFDDNPDHTYK